MTARPLGSSIWKKLQKHRPAGASARRRWAQARPNKSLNWQRRRRQQLSASASRGEATALICEPSAT
eukprot:14946552-Alexandrium_andersonii.AAC.1